MTLRPLGSLATAEDQVGKRSESVLQTRQQGKKQLMPPTGGFHLYWRKIASWSPQLSLSLSSFALANWIIPV